MSDPHKDRPKAQKVGPPSWKETLLVTSVAAVAFGLAMLKAKPEDPEEAKKPKLNNGCTLNQILTAVTKPAFTMAADGTLLEIRGTLDTGKSMTISPACRPHLDKTAKNPEMVITFKPRPDMPSASPPAIAPAKP